MIDFFRTLSNREIALGIWVLIFIIAVLTQKGIRHSIFSLIKSYFAYKLVIARIGFIGYIILKIFILYKLNIWNFDLLKDTILWYITVGMILFHKIHDVKQTSYFKTLFLDSFKLTIITEFILNFYNFNLAIELILIPMIVVIASVQAFAEMDSTKNPDYVKVSRFLKNTLNFIGWILIIYSTYRTITEFSSLATTYNVRSLLISPLLTVLIIPVLYVMALVINYENIFLRVRFKFNETSSREYAKKQIFFSAHINLYKLLKIIKNFNKLEYNTTISFRKQIEKLSKE